MKYSPLLVALAALAPALVHAQNPQFSDCRTLEAAGNFVGPDEAIVNGLVCKVGKPKTNSTTAQASGKTAEKSMALLGILEPETLRSKEKTVTNPVDAEPIPGTNPGSAQGNTAAGGAPSQSVSFKNISLGEIARAYRGQAGVRITTKPEQDDLESNKRHDEKVDRVAIVTQTDKTAKVTTVPRPLLGGTPQASSVPESPSGITKIGKVAAAPTSPSSAPSSAPRTAKIETSAIGQAASPGAPKIPRDEPAVKPETSLSPTGVKAVATSDVQAPTQAAIPWSAHSTPTNELTTASPAPSATAGTRESKPELLPTVASISVPPPSAMIVSAPFETNNNEEDAAFKEGQGPTCRKNISLGSMDKDKLFLAIPVWASQWLEKNQKRFPELCFSDSLMPGAKNYLVVFYMAAPLAAGPTALKHISAAGEMTPRSGMDSFTTSYGSTWHYTYERTVTTTITSASAEKAPHNQSFSLLYATAYSEQGIPISHHSPAGMTKQVKETSHKPGKRDDADLAEFRSYEELLEKMIKDIAKL